MWKLFDRSSPRIPSPEECLPGRAEPMPVDGAHAALGTALTPPWPAGSEVAMFGLGCFWGAERKFWQLPGVVSTQVGYAAMPKGSTSMTEGGRQPAGIQRINAEHARHGMPPDKPPSKFALGTRRKAADGDEWEVRRMDATRTPDEPLTNP